MDGSGHETPFLLSWKVTVGLFLTFSQENVLSGNSPRRRSPPPTSPSLPQHGGRLQGLFIPETVSELVDLVARIVFRGSAYHASINSLRVLDAVEHHRQHPRVTSTPAPCSASEQRALARQQRFVVLSVRVARGSQ